MPTMYVLSKSIENIKKKKSGHFFSFYTAEKNLCILHGRVFVMYRIGMVS